MLKTKPDAVEILIGEVAQQLVEINLQEDAFWYIEHLAASITELQVGAEKKRTGEQN